MRAAAAAVCLLLATGCSAASARVAPPPVWHSAVGQAMSTTHRPALQDQTCRQVLRLTAGGPQVRLRMSNATGTAPTSLSSVTVGLRAGAGVRLLQPVTVDGARAVALGAGEQRTSDPVRLPVVPGDELVVSLAVVGAAEVAAHRVGAARLACSAPGTGDLTSSTSGQGFSAAGREGLVVDDVAVAGGPAGVLAAGDSLTDPELPPDTYPRWTDVLDAQLPAATPVVNAAVAGNRVLLEGGYGPTLLQRFDRDVLGRDGLGTLVLLAGTNDVSAGATAAQLRVELERLCASARERGLRIVLLTVPPASRRGPELEAVRQQVNSWVRTTGAADLMVDADAVLRDPARPTRLLPAYDLDQLHLTAAGHRALGLAVAAALR
ncbi:MAG: hydrolase family protein [Frankiales bacterium]|nr:hydrolase family protein [Frankiales bacterium]